MSLQSTPDTNILVYGIVGSENKYQRELSEDCLDLRTDENHRIFVFDEVMKEYRKVLKDRIAAMRPLLVVAEDFESFEEAEKRYESDDIDQNFWEEAKRYFSPENCQSEIRQFRDDKISSMQRRVNKMTPVEESFSLDKDKISRIEEELTSKDEKVTTDAMILYKLFLLANKRGGITCVSEDGDLRYADLEDVEGIVDLNGFSEDVSVENLKDFFE